LGTENGPEISVPKIEAFLFSWNNLIGNPFFQDAMASSRPSSFKDDHPCTAILINEVRKRLNKSDGESLENTLLVQTRGGRSKSTIYNLNSIGPVVHKTIYNDIPRLKMPTNYHQFPMSAIYNSLLIYILGVVATNIIRNRYIARMKQTTKYTDFNDYLLNYPTVNDEYLNLWFKMANEKANHLLALFKNTYKDKRPKRQPENLTYHTVDA